MKRKITLEFISATLIAILLFVIGAYLIARNNINDITELNLRNYIEILTIEYETDPDVNRIVDKYESIESYIRITFISSDGTVIVDSLAENLENHSNRPEFINLGDAYIRQSDTLGFKMMYIAEPLGDGNIIRLAIPISSIAPFLNDFVGLSIVVGVIIIFITVLLSSALIRDALRPLKEIKAILRRVNNGEYEKIVPVRKQDEINDLITEINDINKLIATNISSLKSETEKTDFLLNHMNQGICVLDKDGLIVMLNQFLRRLYRFNIDINLNKNYRFLFRNDDIQKYIEKAFEKGINTNSVIKIKEEYYSVSINYLEKNWLNQPSVILLFTDVTVIKNIEILKKDFFDNASHELKSPLTSIIGSSDIIIEGMAKDQKTIIDLSRRISEEAKRMNNLVMDMLTLSKYENQQPLVLRRDINVKTVLDEVANSLKRSIEAKNMQLELEKEDIYLIANYEELFQVIKNLIENSVKYGKEAGIIKAKIYRNNLNLVIEIQDNGIGIPKADQSRIFERFFRVDKARSKITGGTGLGLSIVKHIVLNYDGHIELDSIEGKGTTVKVYLPLNSHS
ncbi:MAG: hypothetical protein JEZ05_04370 [Tenericutes bacterium]|nr:hypothetical protein [Mycoplasmatota bacterium]